jgi:hypothetical protein
MGLRVVHRLDVIVYLHRHHTGLVRNIAAYHQHHAEFADGMRETQHRRGQQTGLGQRQYHAEEAIQGRGAQRRRGFQGSFGYGLKCVLQRLHHEGQ